VEGGKESRSINGLNISFEKVAEETLAMIVPDVKYISFEDFILSGEWVTSGSSSIGKVEWKLGEEEGKIKARKNLVPDVIDLKELYTKCQDVREQHHKSIIKAELGKLRIAVASDMENYLIMTWINRMLGGPYSQWEGSTIDESVNEQTNRMTAMIRACEKAFGLPFDYKNFDHQPTTDEVLIIVNILCKAARKNVAQYDLEIYDGYISRLKESFRNSTL